MKLSAYEMDHRDELRAAREEGEYQVKKEKEKGIKAMVSVLQKMKVSSPEIKENIMEQFDLTAEQATKYIK